MLRNVSSIPLWVWITVHSRVAPTPYVPTTQRRYYMSQRHRSQEAVPPPKMDVRAHAHNERHRIHSELDAVAAQVSAGYEPDEVHEPGRAWVPAHHHDAGKVKSSNGSDLQASLEVEDVEAAHHACARQRLKPYASLASNSL